MNNSNVTLIGLDTAKSIFHLHAVNRAGKMVYQHKLRRHQLLDYLAKQTICTVALEACAASHYWARKIQALGHSVRIINARRVKQFSSRNKNDFNDARAITKAARDEDTYFVAQKSIEQQSMQAIHTFREAAIKQRTALINRIRALLAEFGIVLPQGKVQLKRQIPFILEDGENELPTMIRELLSEQYQKLLAQEEEVQRYDQRIRAIQKASDSAMRLSKIPGVGALISTALTHMIADPTLYKNGRNCAASLGLTPKEHSTGGKQRLGSISREGNVYLRRILVQGAHSMLRQAHKRQDALSQWAVHLKEKKGVNITVIALANKIVRIAWAMLVNKQDYQYQPQPCRVAV